MEAKRTRWLALALVLGIGLGLLILALPGGQARARDPKGVRLSQGVSLQSAAAGEASMLAAPSLDESTLSLSNSSVKTTDCYQEDKKQLLCFTVNNGSTDQEWIDVVRLTFPEDTVIPLPAWTVNSSSYEDPADSVGYVVNFTHTISGRQIEYRTADGDGYGEISNGASWEACVDVTVPPGYDGPRMIPWELEGDKTTGVGASGSIEIEKCTPLTLKPSQVVITGCNGLAQSLEFELTNYGAGDGATVNFTYDAPDAEFIGPDDFLMDEEDTITFTAQFEPWACIGSGETVTGTLIVESGPHSDASFINQTISENTGWHRRGDSPVPSMDTVVVWASHADGGLWSIGGYGSNGATQRYDPESDTWETFQSEAAVTPLIEYPVDGCYGLNDLGEEIVVLFPDTLVTDSLHVFNITDRQWYTRPIPIFFPSTPTQTYDYIGFWGLDVVSLLNNPVVNPNLDRNMCYLSGGNHQNPGGGSTRNLWRYDPEDNSGEWVGDFADPTVVFGFHASWYVPWIGEWGSICVAGGADHNHYIHGSTRCYDLKDDAPASEDLGTLPEPWWGMADGWQMTDYGYELWIANGVAQDGTLLPASAYFREGMTDFAYGPPIPHGLYRLEGDTWGDQFYTLNGSRGGFWYSEFSLHFGQCPTCHQVFLPLILRDH
jgi:hypothetical protein